MKRSITRFVPLCLAIVFITAGAFAGDLRLCLELSGDYSFRGTSALSEFIPGARLDIKWEYRFSGIAGVRAGLMSNLMDFYAEIPNSSGATKIWNEGLYVGVPLEVFAYLPLGDIYEINLTLGYTPSFNVISWTQIDYSDGTEDVSSSYMPSELAMINGLTAGLGTGIKAGPGMVTLGAYYTWYLTGVNNLGNLLVTHNIRIAAGYAF